MQYIPQETILDEVAEAVASQAKNVLGFRHVVMTIIMDNFTGTVKFVGSEANTMPDFSQSASKDNEWSYVKGNNLIDGQTVLGGTGFAATGETSVRNVEISTNLLAFVGAIASGVSGGKLTVKLRASNDAN